MFKSLIVSMLVFCGLSYSAAAQQAGSCTKDWTFKSHNAKFTDANVVSIAQLDLSNLKKAYKCVNDASKALPAPDVSGAMDKYKAVINDAVLTNKYAAAFGVKVQQLKDETDARIVALDSSSGRIPGTNNLNKKSLQEQSTKLDAVIKDVQVILSNSAILSSGNYAVYEKAKPNEICTYDDVVKGVSDKISSDPKMQGIDESQSLLSKLLEIEKNNSSDQAKRDEEIKKSMTGDYTEDTKLTEFKDNLKADKYAFASPSATTTVATPNTGTTVATDPSATTSVTTPDSYSKDDVDKLLAANAEKLKQEQQAKEFDDMKKTLTAIQEKENIPPASSTSSSSTPSTPSSVGGSVSAQAPQGMDAEREAQKKKWLERAKAAEESAMRQAMQKALKAGRQSGKLAFQKGTGSSFSLRDLFNKGGDDTEKKQTKELAMLDQDLRPTGDPSDKYKKYYKMGKGPDEVSSKNLYKSRFDSMYEAARIKALTEGADSEYAGRYVDMFLLIHSIMDDYYKKGLLVDTEEMVEPINLRK